MTTATKTEKKDCSATPVVGTGTAQKLSACSGSSEQQICCDEIREKAYQLWEQAGSPEGDGVDFWLEAERQLQNDN